MEALPPSTWPSTEVPQQVHLDIAVPDDTTLRDRHELARRLGATVLHDGSTEAEPIYVYADLSGHPFCIFHAS